MLHAGRHVPCGHMQVEKKEVTAFVSELVGRCALSTPGDCDVARQSLLP